MKILLLFSMLFVSGCTVSGTFHSSASNQIQETEYEIIEKGEGITAINLLHYYPITNKVETTGNCVTVKDGDNLVAMYCGRVSVKVVNKY